MQDRAQIETRHKPPKTFTCTQNLQNTIQNHIFKWNQKKKLGIFQTKMKP
jgi:hypothetical protein